MVACDEDVYTEGRSAAPGGEQGTDNGNGRGIAEETGHDGVNGDGSGTGTFNDEQQGTPTASDNQWDTSIVDYQWSTQADDAWSTSDAPSSVDPSPLPDIPLLEETVSPGLISSVSSPSSTPLVTPCASNECTPYYSDSSTAYTPRPRFSHRRATQKTTQGAMSHRPNPDFYEDTIEGAMAQEIFSRGDGDNNVP